MAVDMYVMPLWRFKTRYFEPVMDRFCKEMGTTGKRISPGGIEEMGGEVVVPAAYDVTVAKNQVTWLQLYVSHQAGSKITWRDEGDVLYGKQAHGMADLRTFAKHMEVHGHKEGFVPPEPHSEGKHPVWRETAPPGSPPSRLYPLLTGFNFSNGYVLPGDFAGLLKGDTYVDFMQRELTRPVVSVKSMLEELGRLGEALAVPCGAEPHDDFAPNGCPKELFLVFAAFRQLGEVLRLSAQSDLPVIFWG